MKKLYGPQMLLIYAFERVRDHKNSLLNNKSATNVYCLCLLNSYIRQVLIAYAYITVTDHKC